MDKIYDPKSFRSSEPFNTKEYFKKFSEACPFIHPSDINNTPKYNIITDMGIPEDEYDFDTLEESCRYGNFFIYFEIYIRN